MHEPYVISINIPCPAELLAWIICILFTGVAMTSKLIHEASKFATDSEGKHIGLQKLHRTASKESMLSLLEKLPVTTKNSLKKQLRIDFIFMPFLYLLMLAFSGLILYVTCECSPWKPILCWLCWIPFLIWIFDVMENVLMRSVFSQFETDEGISSASLSSMTVANLLKWAVGAAWLLVHLSHGISWLIVRFA